MSLSQANDKTYDQRGRLLRHTHDSLANQNETLYIKGDAFTDGSMRLNIDVLSSVAVVEARANGVWNTGPLELSGRSLLLGNNLSLSAVGSSLEINSVEGVLAALVVAAEITDSGSFPPVTAIADTIIPRFVLQPIFTEQLVGTEFLRAASIVEPISGHGSVFYLKTGSIPATDTVTITITEGLVPGGALLFSERYPASLFFADTEVVLPLNSPVGFFAGEDILNTVSSDTAFSLLGDTADNFWVAFDFQPVIFEELLSHPSGINRMLSDVRGSMIVDSLGNIIIRDYVSPLFAPPSALLF